MALPKDVYERIASQEWLKANAAPVRVIAEDGILVDNRYFSDGVPGASCDVFLRQGALRKLREARRLIEPEYGFVIFDGFRSRKTQAGLFEAFSGQIRARNPEWDEERIQSETRKFVAHPNEPGRFEVPPHLSGGAVDVGFTRRGVPVDMGTAFDDLTDLAATEFFEQPFSADRGIPEERWMMVRENRRVLHRALTTVGFTNWHYEWWHYDLGNCLWSRETGLPWVYGEMIVEDAVLDA